MKKKKRPFILLEVLIALALISLFTIPFFKTPLLLCKSEIRAMKEMELSRIASLTLADFKEKFYKNEIDWDKMERKEQLPNMEITLPGYEPMEVERNMELSFKEFTEEKNDTICRRVVFKIDLSCGKAKKSETCLFLLRQNPKI